MLCKGTQYVQQIAEVLQKAQLTVENYSLVPRSPLFFHLSFAFTKYTEAEDQ